MEFKKTMFEAFFKVYVKKIHFQALFLLYQFYFGYRGREGGERVQSYPRDVLPNFRLLEVQIAENSAAKK
jgi:hypothetical protein